MKIIIIIIVLALIIGAYLFGKRTAAPLISQPSSPVPVASTTPSSAISADVKYVVHANDGGVDLGRLLTMEGSVAQVTFFVNATDTSHGGLDFRSPIVNTGPIQPGSSKTVIFTTQQPFAFTPYWVSNNTPATYKITVGVGIQ